MKLSLICSAFGLLLLAAPAVAQTDPVEATTKTVDEAGREITSGIDAQTKWVGQTLDDFLTDPTETPSPEAKKRHHFQGRN